MTRRPSRDAYRTSETFESLSSTATMRACIAAAGALGLTAHFRSLSLSVLFFTMIAFANAFLPAFWAIPTTLLDRSAAAAAVGLINGIASIAGFASPYLLGYLSTRTGSFSAGMAAITAAGIAGGLLIFRIPKTVRAPAS